MNTKVTVVEWTKSKRKFIEVDNTALAASPDIVQRRRLRESYRTSRSRANETIDWPLRNRSPSVAPLTGDFQAIVAFSRLLGCHPHPMTSSARATRTTWLAKGYSLVWVAGLTAMIALETGAFVMCRLGIKARGTLCTVQIGNRILVLSSHLMCAGLSVVRAQNFDEGIRRIQDFDEATRATRKFRTLKNVAAVAFLLVTLGVQVWLNLITEHIRDSSNIFFQLHLVVTTMEVNKFCLVFYALLSRFSRLKTLAVAGKIDVKTTKGVYYQPLTVQHVFILRQWLSEATGNFNRYFDIQIIYWIVYFTGLVLIDALVMSRTAQTTQVGWVEHLWFLIAIYHPTLICTVSHFTSKRANELGGLLFGSKTQSLCTTVSSLEFLELGYYLYHVPVKVTGMKMFCFDLPLLLSIFEVTATHTTFILQNAKEVYSMLVVNNVTRTK